MKTELVDTGEKLIPIIVEIVFTIKHNSRDGLSLWYEGKAHPHVSSGCSFGGCCDYVDKEQIKHKIAQECAWFKASYGRPVIEKIQIVDERKKQNTLF